MDIVSIGITDVVDRWCRNMYDTSDWMPMIVGDASRPSLSRPHTWHLSHHHLSNIVMSSEQPTTITTDTVPPVQSSDAAPAAQDAVTGDKRKVDVEQNDEEEGSKK
jgi:hypothetical protein